ncbi:MAG: epoxide hydrolase family protein [Myxococcota bacterium]
MPPPQQSQQAEPFEIRVPDGDIEDLRSRLARTLWPAEVGDSGWEYGTNLGYLRELCQYWETQFDWRAQEALLARFPHYRMRLGGLGIHFVHAQGKGPDPLPLVLSHGWPSSFFEFCKVIDALADPSSHGGDPADAFHVVVPSLPGYGFSEASSEPGLSPRRIAALWAELMENLGYARFGAHGGDWGSYVTSFLGHDFAARVPGIHMTMVAVSPPRGTGSSEGEQRGRGRRSRTTDEFGYQAIQSTKPQTLAYGLTDSPAGLAGWIVEKWRAWADCDGDVERRFTKDELLTNISLYWFTRSIGSSVRLYYESRRDVFELPEGKRIEAPAGFALFSGQGRYYPRSRAERAFNVVRWSEIPRGGHFPAMEEPDLLVDEIRTFFRPLRARRRE